MSQGPRFHDISAYVIKKCSDGNFLQIFDKSQPDKKSDDMIETSISQ